MSRSTLALLLILGSATAAQAREIPPASMGVSGVAIQVVDSSTANTTDLLVGGGLEATIPASDNFAFQMRYYTLKGNGGSKASNLGGTGTTLNGGSLALLLGTNWRHGWNGYIGLGGYSNRISGVSGVANTNMEGVEGMMGFGYRGSTFTFNLSVGGRPSVDFETNYFPNSGGKVRVFTTTFDIGMRL